MDNDKTIVKKIKQKIKDMKFRSDYKDLTIMSDKDGNNWISDRLDTDTPFLVARGGATEMRCIGEYLKTGTFSEKIKEEIKTLSGVFSNDDDSLKKFCELYIECMGHADLIALWGVGAESQVVHKYCQNSELTELHAIEPYYFDNPWSSHLEGKKLLVIHPFIETIKHQFSYRSQILEKGGLPNKLDLLTIKAVQTSAGVDSDFLSWFEALDSMKKQIDKIDFDIAIVGAGAYGLPLAAYCKQKGSQAIQMSGATQILFGIKGKRWDRHPFISNLYNDYWVRPALDETPLNKEKVEGGSYW